MGDTDYRKRIVELDIARGLSMLYIVFVFHMFYYIGITPNVILSYITNSALTIFTFISGFLLGTMYSFTNWKSCHYFLKKRIFRFYPLFFISSILLLITGSNGLFTTIKGLFGLSPFWYPQQWTLWYIAMLLIFYVITPIIKRKKLISSIIASLCVLSIFLIFQKFIGTADFRTIYYFIPYSFGIIMSYFRDLSLKIFSSYLLLLSSIPLLLIYVYVYWCIPTPHWALEYFIGFLGAIVYLNFSFVVIKLSKKVPNRINSKVKTILLKLIMFLSYVSMCAYLFHREIYWILTKIPPTNIIENVILPYLVIFALLTILAIAYIIQKTYDMILSLIGNCKKVSLAA